MANEKKKISTDDDAGKGAPNTGNSDTTQPTGDIKDDSKDKPADTAQADDSKDEPADTAQADKKSKIQTEKKEKRDKPREKKKADDKSETKPEKRKKEPTNKGGSQKQALKADEKPKKKTKREDGKATSSTAAVKASKAAIKAGEGEKDQRSNSSKAVAKVDEKPEDGPMPTNKPSQKDFLKPFKAFKGLERPLKGVQQTCKRPLRGL